MMMMMIIIVIIIIIIIIMCACTHEVQKQVLDPLDLKLQYSLHWVLGSELRYSNE